MKRFLLTMTILMVVFGNMVAQDRSIRFEEGSYQEALNKAKKENKPLRNPIKKRKRHRS